MAAEAHDPDTKTGTKADFQEDFQEVHEAKEFLLHEVDTSEYYQYILYFRYLRNVGGESVSDRFLQVVEDETPLSDIQGVSVIYGHAR